jgi:hypothetical protein
VAGESKSEKVRFSVLVERFREAFYASTMSELPDGAFQPAGGKLGQMIFENPGEEIDPHLQFFIEIAFQPFELDDEVLSPLLRINNIVVPAKSWKDLAESGHEFPYAPKPGSVDGAVMLFGEQNPADVTQLQFGECQDGKIAVQFSTEVDFEIEADREDLEQIEMNFDLLLEVQSLRISTSLEKRCDGDEDAIVSAVVGLVDLEVYGPLEKVAGGFVFSVS